MSTDSETLLKSFIDSEKIPHALIFVGSDFQQIMSSTLSFVKEVFMRLDCNEAHLTKMDHKSHPDFHEFSPASKTGQYSIEQIKQICTQSNLYPNEAPKQFFVIKHADRMQDAAANALLKTLEEPSKDSLFILIVENIDQVLPTISSRVQKIFFQDNDCVSENKSYFTSLTDLLNKWPNYTYNDIFVACEDIQKKLEEEVALQKNEENSQASFIDKEACALLKLIQKWYQKKMLDSNLNLISVGQFENTIEYAQSALKRSMKPSSCLEYILLNFTS
ncbi:MAG: hypothetical protein S4CHLAM6_14940 [Chlamydiae bacterium]|nr:hypothetical protein [Chlamydiota bacterium]